MLEKVKTAVFVSGGGTNLQAILDAAARGEIKSAEIALVLSSREGVYALERAEKAGVKTAVSVKKGRGRSSLKTISLPRSKKRG